MVLERMEIEVVDFNSPCSVSVPAGGKCELVLREKMEVKEFKYLRTVLCKHVVM